MSINLDKSQAFDKLVSLKPYDVHSVSSERIKVVFSRLRLRLTMPVHP